MSEYWVSQAKFYCKFCNVWIADNKPTRQLHDGGAKHRFNVDDFHKKKRNEKLFGARSEGEIKQQLAEIERAAKEAVAADKLEATGLFYQKPAALGPGPPPPPPAKSTGADKSDEARSSSYGNGTRDTLHEENEQQDVIEEDEAGMYVVDGQMYLEGPKHENLLTRGMNCEVFIEDTDQWYSAVVLGRRDVAVPHTSIILRTFEISYVKIEGQDEDENENEDEEVKEQEEGREDEDENEDIVDEVEEDDGINTMIEEPVSSIPEVCSTPPPPVEEDAPPPPPPPPPLFKMPMKAVMNDNENINENRYENRNENRSESENKDEVIPVKRVRRSRWDTVTVNPPLVGSAGLGQAVYPPPPPPPRPLQLQPSPILNTVINSVAAVAVAVDGSKEDNVLVGSRTIFPSTHGFLNDNDIPQGLNSIIDEKSSRETAELSDLQALHEEMKEIEPDVQTIVISGVRSDHLRLLCNEAGELHGPSGDVVSTSTSRAGIIIPEVVESTGFGTWQTVSVRMVDEEEEALLREEEARKEIEDAKQATVNIHQSKGHLPEEDVMSTFDPYGTSIYKGRRVNQDQGNDEVVTMAKKGEVVGFKKRKKSGMAANTVSDGRQDCANFSSSSSSSSSSSGGGSSSTHIVPTNLMNKPQDTLIKTEKVEITKTVLDQQNLNIAIKTEIKEEPCIESGIKTVKTTFSFNGSRKQQKS